MEENLKLKECMTKEAEENLKNKKVQLYFYQLLCYYIEPRS